MRRLLFAAPLFFVFGCGDGASGAASASASAAPKQCSADLPQAERVSRCEGGEALCCTAMMSGIPKTAPDYFDKLALACRNGAESSCDLVRDSDRDAKYKAEALAAGCTKLGGPTCRTAAMLAVLVAPERAPAAISAYCRQTGDATFRISTATIDCKKVDAAALAPLEPDAKACREGDLAGCKALAGVDGGAHDIYDAVAWGVRGVAKAEAEKGRVKTEPYADAAPMGRVSARAANPTDAAAKAVAASLEEQKDTLRKCVGFAKESKEPLGGPLRLELTVDKIGRVVSARLVDKEPDNVAVPTCLRAVVQDLRVSEPGEVRKVEVVLTPGG